MALRMCTSYLHVCQHALGITLQVRSGRFENVERM
jgi:hypothetical protein